MNHRRLLLAIALLPVLAAHGTSSALEKITLAQNQSPISGVSIIAKRQKFFEKHGLEGTVTNFTSGKQCLDTVIGGGADMATTAAAMSNQRIAFLARTEYSDLKTLTSNAAGITTLGGLKGKHTAYTAGTGGDVYTQALLKKAGLTRDDVKLVNLLDQCAVAVPAGLRSDGLLFGLSLIGPALRDAYVTQLAEQFQRTVGGPAGLPD